MSHCCPAHGTDACRHENGATPCLGSTCRDYGTADSTPEVGRVSLLVFESTRGTGTTGSPFRRVVTIANDRDPSRRFCLDIETKDGGRYIVGRLLEVIAAVTR